MSDSRIIHPLVASERVSSHGTSHAPCAVRVPGSKSHTIRALLLSALTRGKTCIINPLYSEDTKSAITVIENWGARCTANEDTLEVDTSALHELLNPVSDSVYVGNSGTTLFFASALATLSDKPLTFDGDASLRTRSAAPLLKALQQLGAHITCLNKNACAPYTVRGTIHAGDITVQCPTSQYASALLYALSCVEGTSILQPLLVGEHAYVDMTLFWLRLYGAEIEHNAYTSIALHKGIGFPHAQSRSPLFITGDYSSASFFFCAAAITGISIAVHGLHADDTQADTQVLDIVRAMGCTYIWSKENEQDVVTVQCSEALRAGEFDLSAVPDALPILAVLSCFVEGDVRFYNVSHARSKETDRIAVMCTELTRLGVHVKEYEDGLVIRSGCGLQSGEVDSHHDHRVAMAFAIGALAAAGPIVIQHADASTVTFPTFYNCLTQLGARVQ